MSQIGVYTILCITFHNYLYLAYGREKVETRENCKLHKIMEKHIKPLLEENDNSQLLGVLLAVFAIIITLGNVY